MYIVAWDFGGQDRNLVRRQQQQALASQRCKLHSRRDGGDGWEDGRLYTLDEWLSLARLCCRLGYTEPSGRLLGFVD